LEPQIAEMQQTIDSLTAANKELLAFKQDYNSQKQSFMRMSTRLKKLCKRLAPTSEIVTEMQQLASEIKSLTRSVTEEDLIE
jgi:hypothetical protein